VKAIDHFLKEASMRELMAFVLGAAVGAGVMALYWRRVAAELAQLKQTLLKEKKALGSEL
jgi:hypothetical protein